MLKSPSAKTRANLHTYRDSKSEIRRSFPENHPCQKGTPVLLLGFFPSVTYSFPTIYHSEEPTSKNPKLEMTPVLNRMGYAKSTPQAILYSPHSLGGAGLRSFFDEQGSCIVELVLQHFRSTSMANTQLHIALLGGND
jgi:hypothetical protein